MDFDMEPTPLVAFDVHYNDMEVKFTAFLNTAAAEASFTFNTTTENVSFTLRLPVFLDHESGLQGAIAAMLYRFTCFDDPDIFDMTRHDLYNFCLQTLRYCNNVRGVRICVDVNLGFVVPDMVGVMIDDGVVLDAADDEEGEIIERSFGGVAASDSAIAKLERVNSAVGDFGQDACCICFEEFEIKKELEFARMPCSHVFHYECIVQWLERSRVCPLCRYQMS